MRKLLSSVGSLIVTLALTPITFAQETAEQVVIEEIPATLNLVITRPSDDSKWLLRMEKGCPAFQKGQKVRLGIKGELNGHDDYITHGDSYTCPIKESIQFDETVTVDYAYRNEARVIDEGGIKWTIFNYEGCNRLRAHMGGKLYIQKQENSLSVGDTIYPPGDAEKCAIRVIERYKDKLEEVVKTTNDDKRPTRVSQLRAIPRKDAVNLYWRPAYDNIGINHYIISYSENNLDPKHITLDSAPNQSTTTYTNAAIENLESDQDYYFYVLAVDASGNTSSLWSEVTRARVKSAIAEDITKQTGQGQLNVRKIYESEQSYLFQWDQPPTATRYVITLRASGKVEYIDYRSAGNQIRILKRDSRKGKKLELTIAAFSPYGFINQEKFDLSF